MGWAGRRLPKGITEDQFPTGIVRILGYIYCYVKSDLFWGIWQWFRDHGIEIPYLQRDVHLKSIPEAMLRTGPEEG